MADGLRVMCSCQPALGHYLPMVGMAVALQQAGHRVSFVTAGEFAARAGADGFDTMPAGEGMAAAGARVIQAHPEFFTLSPLAMREFVFEYVFGGEVLERKFASVYDAAVALRPDVILHDPGELAAPLVAALLGCVNVCVGYGLALPPGLRAAAAEGARSCWERNGLPVPPDAGLFRHLYLDRWPPAMGDPDVPAITTAKSLRPSLPPAPDDYHLPDELLRLDGRPLVYATLGTVYNQDLSPLQRVLDGLSRLPVNVVTTVGPGSDPAGLVCDPTSTVVATYIPHAALLARCSLVVTHGGSGSILEPLLFGIPVVVIPRGADHFENAAAVERVGAGVTVLDADLTPDRIAVVAGELLGDGERRAAAGRVAEQIAALPSPVDRIPLIEQLAATRQ